MPATHLTERELRDFLLGKLTNETSIPVESHLADCTDCQERAAAETPADALVTLLAAASTHLDRTAQADLSTPVGESATRTFVERPPSRIPLTPPAELTGHPKYRVLGPLGAGGMGTVWLAEHLVMGKPVALKVIRPECAAKPGAADRFRREVRAAARLAHPNVAAVFDAEQVGEQLVLVMEYVPGEPLSHTVRHGPLLAAEACRAVCDAARGLAHAHAAGLVHRDVKPSNLVRTPDSQTKLLDFGLAVVPDPDVQSLTGADLIVGTPDYIAPEQAADPRTADARSDIYALGCTLYHLLSGRVPYPADAVMKKLDAHRDPTIQPMPLGAPPELAAVVAKMMAKNPADRYRTAAEVADAVEPFTESVPRVLAEPIRGASGTRPRWLVAAGLLVAFIGLAVAGVVTYRIQTDKGELVIEATDDDVEVVVKQGGKVVTIVDPKSKQKLVLNSGEYEFELDGKPAGLKLDVSKATLKRGDTVVAKIERVMKPEPSVRPIVSVPTEARLPLKPGEVFVFRGHTDGLVALAVSPDGTFAVTGGSWPHHKDGVLRMWDLGSGKEVKQFRGHDQYEVNDICNVAISPDGKRLLSCSSDGTARHWDIKRGAEIAWLGAIRPGIRVLSIACTPDGKQAVVGATEPRLFDLATNKEELNRFEKYHVDNMRAVAVSPDGTTLATGDSTGVGEYDAVTLWDVKSGKRLHSIRGHKTLVFAVAWSPDGKRVASASHDGTARVWEAAQGRSLLKLEHPRGVHGVAYSPGGKYLLTGCADHAVRLWDAETGAPVHTLKGHDLDVWTVAFTPDGRHALSVSEDKTMRMWRLPDQFVDPKAK
ncbi:MAG: protein kinase [Gemmataceae bacterium]